jgi:Protein of unknown function (DUF1501)
MLTLARGNAALFCHRRELLRLGGGMAVAGLTMPSLLCPQTARADERIPGRGARSCILVYLLGGPPHQDMFDLKPEAPAEIRGPFDPIATTVPGLQICELLPKLAGLAGKYALIRSVISSDRRVSYPPLVANKKHLIRWYCDRLTVFACI